MTRWSGWRDRIRAVRWRDLAPALVLGVVLLVIGAVVLFGAVGRGPRTSPSAGPSGAGTLPATPSGSLTAIPSPAPSTTVPPSSPGTPPTSGLPSINPSSLPSLPGCLAPQSLTVMTFNIHGGVRVRSPRVFALGRIVAEIKAARPDVVLLQEIDRHRKRSHGLDVPAALGARLGMSSAFGLNVRHGSIGEYGTAILSRFPITRTQNVPLPRPPGTQQRGLLLAELSVSGQQVDVYDTHLENTSPTARRLQITRIRGLLAGDDHPIVLGGDFNAAPSSDTLGVARGFLRDSWAEVGSGAGATHGGRHHLRVDYLLHNSWLTPLSAQVRPSSVSDHRPLRVGYALWSSPDCGT